MLDSTRFSASRRAPLRSSPARSSPSRVAWLACLATCAACDAPRPSSTEGTTSPAPSAATTSSAQATDSTAAPPDSTDAGASTRGTDAGAQDQAPTTSFDGPPAESLGWSGSKLRWKKNKLEIRSIEGWKGDLVRGYPVVRSEDRRAFVALFGDVGAMPPRTHLDMRVGWFEASPVDWSVGRKGKLGAAHLDTEQREGDGKLRVTHEGKSEVLTARFWALYVELPGRSDGLLVVAAATKDASDRVPELVGMIQSLAVPP